MIRYALRCAADHRFESWFQSASAYDGLAERGLVSCPVCGGNDVTKAMMAPRVASVDAPEGKRVAVDQAAAQNRPLSGPAHPAEQMLKALRDHVEKTSTYVGRRFAAEARAMHLGERDEGAIHGEATPEEARALIEEGVPIAPLPMPIRGKSN
ncbi:DUF1178 family protein [Roseibacterium sp. SDUM158016]|jgi:hypothetical protein|uniref:DUF1178 family protein n=1 Tax=Roseicyclus sediminis TaxID=2980997 RepID=UPI0021CF1132|nr:DUF1178 family protein [Roseibacterium sp. SDUM158016]MCU4653689.1 DUF1178 family protein [Roseibacterium sp. SDUM158016]